MQFGRRGHEQNLRLGLGGGLEQASIDCQKLRFSDQIDPREGFIYATQEVFPTQSRFNPDIHFGAVYYNRVAWVGVSAHHLTQPYQTFITTVNSVEKILGGFGPKGYATPARAFGKDFILSVPGTELKLKSPAVAGH